MCVINMVMECLFKLVFIKYIYRGTKSIGRPRAAPQGPLVIFREKKNPKTPRGGGASRSVLFVVSPGGAVESFSHSRLMRIRPGLAALDMLLSREGAHTSPIHHQ